MMNATTIGGAVLASAALLSGPMTGTAAAQDRRPCVSRVEYWSANTAPSDRAGLEARWEVKGLGRTVDVSMLLPWSAGPSWEAVAYPRCGYVPDEGWYGVMYKTPVAGPDADTQVASLILQWHRPGVTDAVHGQPRSGLSLQS